MKTCIFCDIIEGRAPSQTVWQDNHVSAFLDVRPLFPGHVLIVPKRHVVTLPELDSSALQPFFEAVQLIAQAMPRALSAQGTFTANNDIVSQSVPHLHWHVVPRSKGDGLKGFFWPRQPYSSDEHQQQVATRLREVIAQEQILRFWFGPPAARSDEFHTRRWFVQDPEFDRAIREGFEPLMQRALAGELQHWAEEPRGRLALLILLDQFTRNLGRHTAAAFSGDERAQKLCLEGIELGHDRALSLDERVFFYLPLEHGETRTLQELSLQQFGALVEAADEPHKARYRNFLDYAQRHAEIIFRFERYPHRNQALGRASSPEEEAFLSGPGSSFW